MEATQDLVTLFIDPSCPFAWITSRWLLDVAQQLPVHVTFRVMSLSVLNENRELDPWYRQFNDRAWGPARVAAAVQHHHGAEALAAFYAEFGTRNHTHDRKDNAVNVPAALAAVGLPAELADLADPAHGTAYDQILRDTHAEVQKAVGAELGTPVIVFGENGTAFFGPVCTAIPRGAEAVALFHAVRSAAAIPAFTELKRGRADALDYS
jgi:hypothetical protein